MTQQTYSSGPSGGFPANGKGFLFAPVLWFMWFVALYAVQGAGCEIGLDTVSFLGTNSLRFALGALSLGVAMAIAFVGVWSFRAWDRFRPEAEDSGRSAHDQSMFLAYGAMLNAALFLVAIAWIGLPILMADVCRP